MPKFHVTTVETENIYTTYEVDADSSEHAAEIYEEGSVVENSIDSKPVEIFEIEEDC